MTLTSSTITDEQFVRIRCGTDNRTYYFEATGSMYAHPLDQDPPLHLFNFVGVDVSRCLQDPTSGQWSLVSRKFSLYLDPKTGEVLRQWQNPWTEETLTVIHRSYDYQEFQVPPQVPANIGPVTTAVSLDLNLKLPNPLATKPEFKDYSPEPYVQSADSYKFLFPTRFLQEPLSGSDQGAVALSYYRTGPWEPWMKMKGKPGFLVLNYTGVKTDAFAQLAPLLQNQIETRMPLYREAPPYRLQRSIATSWSRFEEEFVAYQQGQEFPLPAPIKTEPRLEQP